MNTFNYLILLMFMAFVNTSSEYNKPYGFTHTIRTAYSLIKLDIFRYCYTHWKWFRKRAMKKFRKSMRDPFMVFSFDQLLMGGTIDYENEQERDQCIEQYVKENDLSEEDAAKLKSSIDDLVKKIIEERSKDNKQ